MKNKVIKYTIILLLIPLIISIIIAIATDGKGFNNTSNNSYDSMDIVQYDNSDVVTQIENGSTFIYLSVITLVILGVSVWVYVKKEKDS